MSSDTRNLVLAIALSVLVIVAWQFLVIGPQTQAEMERRQAAAQSESAAPTAPSVAAPQIALPREEAVATSGQRIPITSQKLGGSIRLRGSRIDDLQLHGYRETNDPKSPEIVLFAPTGTATPYYAEFGFAPAANATMALPNETTEWHSNGAKLSPSSPVVLTWDNGQGLFFRREISLDQNYLFTVVETVENTGEAPVDLYPYALISRHGQPQHMTYWVLHEGLIGVFNETLQEVDYSEVRDAGTIRTDSTGGWIGITDKYWMAAVAPQQDTTIRASFTDRAEGPREIFQTDFIHASPMTIAPGASASATHHLFAGAKVVSIVDRYAEEGPKLDRFDLAVDWGWFFIITKPIFIVLDWLYHLVGNFGVAILLLTVLIKLVFFPLANRSYEAMSKMKKVQPEMMRLRDQYKDDPMEQQKQLMELYRREKVNPVMGCLPVLIQIPVFFSLYKVLFVTIEMRHAPFFGWIQDLSAPDPTSIFNLFGLLPFTVPEYYLGLPLHIGIWPLIMGVSMWVQMQLNPPPTDPIQQRIFSLMPWIFTFMLATFPAGLVIYWTWNNLLSILQQAVIMRRMGVPIEGLNRFGMPGWLKGLIDRVRNGRAGDAGPSGH
ncbi:MAG: membrane protein insertase YidC [Alphaproteobacteria bacterium]|nr:membrane protein insertase YidC [Alphaproteobacteria bacterium]